MKFLSKEVITESLSEKLETEYKSISESIMKTSLTGIKEFKILNVDTNVVLEESFSSKTQAQEFIGTITETANYAVIEG